MITLAQISIWRSAAGRLNRREQCGQIANSDLGSSDGVVRCKLLDRGALGGVLGVTREDADAGLVLVMVADPQFAFNIGSNADNGLASGVVAKGSPQREQKYPIRSVAPQARHAFSEDDDIVDDRRFMPMQICWRKAPAVGYKNRHVRQMRSSTLSSPSEDLSSTLSKRPLTSARFKDGPAFARCASAGAADDGFVRYMLKVAEKIPLLALMHTT